MSSIVSPSKPVTNAIWLPLLVLWGLATTLAILGVYLDGSANSSDERIINSFLFALAITLVVLRYVPMAATATRRLHSAQVSLRQRMVRRYHRTLTVVVGVDLALIGLPLLTADLYWPNRIGYGGLLWFALYGTYACVALVATVTIASLVLSRALRKDSRNHFTKPR